MKARDVGELISCTSDLYPQLEWPKKLKPLVDAEQEEEEAEEGIAKHDTLLV
jgi:hypothetical protein